MSFPPLREELRGVTPYGAPQLDVPVQLNVNENPYAPSEALAASLSEAIAAVALELNRYPDITAAEEWELASSAVAELGLPEPEDEDEQAPAGDLDILGDLGMGAMDMGVLLDDFDLYPDEMLSDVARRLGFGELFDEAVGLASA